MGDAPLRYPQKAFIVPNPASPWFGLLSKARSGSAHCFLAVSHKTGGGQVRFVHCKLTQGTLMMGAKIRSCVTTKHRERSMRPISRRSFLGSASAVSAFGFLTNSTGRGG